jgi:hypothetical protein
VGRSGEGRGSFVIVSSIGDFGMCEQGVKGPFIHAKSTFRPPSLPLRIRTCQITNLTRGAQGVGWAQS